MLSSELSIINIILIPFCKLDLPEVCLEFFHYTVTQSSLRAFSSHMVRGFLFGYLSIDVF